MKIRKSGFQFEIKTEDLIKIRSAIKQWKSKWWSENFDGSSLYQCFESWEHFIDTEWCTWDVSEYNHDIECRYFIQLAIENSTSLTKVRLNELVKPFDEIFIKNMKPYKKLNFKKIEIFNSQPYFWEINTIHPDYRNIDDI